MSSLPTLVPSPGRLVSLTHQLRGEYGKSPIVICDPDEISKFESQRMECGSDLYDEVWEGVTYVMSLPNDEHQEIVTTTCTIIRIVFGFPGPHHVRGGVNVSDRIEQWKENYRCPDIAVYMDGNPAINCGTHWCGGPDFLVEIISPGDPAREKLLFYASINTREVLIIDRKPWQIVLNQLQNGTMVEVGKSSLSQPDVLTSSVLPLTFRLVPGTNRPQIEIIHTVTSQTWKV